MGRRNHLIRVALAATQNQIEEPASPTGFEDEVEEEEDAAAIKFQALQHIDQAQTSVLSATGLMMDDGEKKDKESSDNSLISLSTVCGMINYHLSLPCLSLRYQILTFRNYNSSYLSLFRESWRIAVGYGISMHHLQPRIVHKFRKLYRPASQNTAEGLLMRVGLSLLVNLGTSFILYPFWRHAVLQILLLAPSWEVFPPIDSFFHNRSYDLTTFFLSYLYNFGFFLFQINVHKTFKRIVYPTPDTTVENHEGTYPSALTSTICDIIPGIMGLGMELISLRSLARHYGPPGLVMNTVELGNVGLMVKALAAEWAVEWAWLEVQYWTNELWYWYKGYNNLHKT